MDENTLDVIFLLLPFLSLFFGQIEVIFSRIDDWYYNVSNICIFQILNLKSELKNKYFRYIAILILNPAKNYFNLTKKSDEKGGRNGEEEEI